MDIEEGEIIISDVSSDESNVHPQPWDKEKPQNVLTSYRYQNTSRSSTVDISSPARNKTQHSCNETSFCRKIFYWRDCLGRGEQKKRRRTRNKNESRSNEKSHGRQKYNEHSGHSSIQNRQKKRKHKERSENFHSSRYKPERTLRQLSNHGENRQELVNEMIQQLSITPSATVTNENTSLMQKLITSGLAKLPIGSGAPSGVGIILSGTESETCIKKETGNGISIESSDSEIEVIIPPIKVPALVTLDSDGEEMEQLETCLGNAKPSQSLDHEQETIMCNVASTSIEVGDTSTTEQNEELNKNKPVNITLNDHDLSTEHLLPNQTSEDVNVSSDSSESDLISELFDALLFSPSSPSSCNSDEESLTKNPSLLSSGGNSTSQNVQFEDKNLSLSLNNDFSMVNSQEINSEIWLDSSEQQTVEYKNDTIMLPSSQNVVLNKALCKENLNPDSNEKSDLEKENSLSDLVENFIMRSKPLAKDTNTNKRDIVTDGKSPSFYREKKCEIEPVKSCDKTKNVDDEQILTNVFFLQSHSQREVDGEYNNNHEQNSSDHVLISSASNESYMSTVQKVSSDDRKPCSPHSGHDSNKSKENYNSLNSNQPDISIKQKSPIETSTTESVNSNSNVFMSLSAEIKNTSNLATVMVNQDPDMENQSLPNNDNTNKYISKEQGNQISSEEIENHSIKNIGMGDDEDISQLRKIALSTKRKTISKDTKSTKCDEYNETGLTSVQNDSNVAEPCSLGATQGLDEDDDVLQLRVAALKSAVIKKYGERKKRGLLVKKRKHASSGFADDIFISSECNLPSEEENENPLSPAKSSASLQGEEDMELANSDVGEDVIEEVNANSIEEESKLRDNVCWGSSTMVDPSAQTFEISSTINTHSRNLSLVVPPQPLPPGVDGNCPELINQTILTSVLKPPPPPPPTLVFTPMLPPPPPPPFPSFSNSNSESTINYPGEISGSKESPSICIFSDSHSEEGPKNNTSLCIEQSRNDQLIEHEKSKKLDIVMCQVRSNLITVPVINNTLKPVLTKNQLRKRKRTRTKSVKVLTEPESSLLCITKPPGKSSFKLGGNSNLKSVHQTNTHSVYGASYENTSNPDINCSKCEDIPVILCNTNPQNDSRKNSENLKDHENIWQKQELVCCEINSADSNLSEEKSLVEDEIDLSDMIVLDEVGMSPEHKSKNESNLDYNSSQEEDEEENALRIKALTTLSPKPIIDKPNSSDLSCPPSIIQHDNYQINWQSYDNGNSTAVEPGRGLSSAKGKLNCKRKVVGPDSSKYRLTRTIGNEPRRSVVQGRESLKVVFPTSSPPLTAPVEPPIPVVKRLVINVEKDSDSEEECEWTRKIRIKDANTFIPPGPVVDHDLERSIDELLMRARKSVDNNSSPKQNAISVKLKQENRSAAENDLILQDTPLKLLPKEKQEEYKRLKAILERKEREIELAKIALSKSQEKSKPLLQHVLRNENNKPNQTNRNFQQDKKSSDDSLKHNLRVGKSKDCLDDKNYCNRVSSSSTVQGLSKCNAQKSFIPDINQKENVTRKVIFNDKKNLNVSLPQTSSGSYHELSQNKNFHLKPIIATDQSMKMVENRKTNVKKQVFQSPTSSKYISRNAKQASTHISTNATNRIKGKFDRKIQSQSTSIFNMKTLQRDEDKNTEFNRYHPEVENENSVEEPVMSKSSSKEGITRSAPKCTQILSVEADCSSTGNDMKQCLSEDQEKEYASWEYCSKNLACSPEKAMDLLELENDGQKSEIHQQPSKAITRNVSNSFEEKALKHCLEEVRENEAFEFFSTNLTLKKKIYEKDNKSCNCCESICDSCTKLVPADYENRNKNVTKSEINTTDTNNVKYVINENEKKKSSGNVKTQEDISSPSDFSELQQQGAGRSCASKNESLASVKHTCAESFKRKTNSLDVSSDSYLTHQESPQRICSSDVEALATKKSELLNERFVLLDDLSEMAESLDDLDSQQGRLEQTSVEIGTLRRALRVAEDNLREQIKIAQDLKHKVIDTRTAVTARYKNITDLERTLQEASYEIPTTAQKLMSKKVKQVREKMDKVKRKQSIIKYLIDNPDITKEEVAEVHASSPLRNTENSDPDDLEMINNLWLQDPSTSELESLPIKNVTAAVGRKTDSETQTNEVLDCLESDKDVQHNDLHAFGPADRREEITYPQTTDLPSIKSKLETGDISCLVTNLSVEAIQSHCTTDVSSSGLTEGKQTSQSSNSAEEENNFEKPSASKHSIIQVSDIFEGATAKKPKLMLNEDTSIDVKQSVVDNTSAVGSNKNLDKENNFERKLEVSNKSGIFKPSKSKMQYKSVLQYKGPKARTDNSSDGQAILCPYDLTGKCQDKQCKFQHFHRLL